MLYLAGEYAWPGFNAVLYAIAFAVVAFSCFGCYGIVKSWQPANVKSRKGSRGTYA